MFPILPTRAGEEFFDLLLNEERVHMIVIFSKQSKANRLNRVH